MNSLFSELRSILHAPTIAFTHVESLLHGAPPEAWDYARPLLDRLTHGNAWAPLHDTHDATSLEWSDDILSAMGRARLDDEDAMGVAHGVLVGEYKRELWRADVRHPTHAWMVHRVEQALRAFPQLAHTLLAHTQALRRWCAGQLPAEALQQLRRDLTQRWPRMSLAAHLEADPLAASPTAQDARAAMIAWGRMGAPSRQGAMSAGQMSAQLDVLRQQWIIWLMLHAMDISKTPLVDVFVELLATYHHLDVLTQPLRWQEHPSRVLIYVQGMMAEVSRDDPAVLVSVREQAQSLRCELGSWLTARREQGRDSLHLRPPFP